MPNTSSSPGQHASTSHQDATVYFDRSGDALIPEGCAVAERPADWVRLALQPGPLVMRGNELCACAEAFYRGRSYQCYELHSPRVALNDLALTPIEGEALLKWLRDFWKGNFATRFGALEQPLEAVPLLSVLFPTTPFGWNAPASPSHVAAWLLWLDENPPDRKLQPLLAVGRVKWSDSVSNAAGELYLPCNEIAARRTLRQWLGLDDAAANFPSTAGPFPREVPLRWQTQAREEWLGKVGVEGFGLWETLQERTLLPASLRRIAAEVVAKFFELHPAQLTASIIAALEGFLPDATVERLREAVPPVLPSDPFTDDLPPSTEQVLTWFRQEYWPFRRWFARRDDVAANEHAENLAQQFALWYARFYAQALGSGKDAPLLAMRHSLTLRERVKSERERGEQTLTLWLVADGLNTTDAHSLVRHIEEKAPRLTLEQDGLAFCALPTITPICKPALRWSSPPANAVVLCEADNPHEHGLKEHSDLVAQLTDAQVGDLWVWNVLQPDTTYHKKFPPELIVTKVDGELQTLATRIAQVVSAVSDHLKLRIVISTDHGRLPQGGPRCHIVPSGGESHGRAVLQKEGEILAAPTWDGRDFVVEETTEGALLWLNPHRFGLKSPAVLALDGAAFQENDGSGGMEFFAHGGAYPEEVIVPWIELVRDRAMPRIEAHVSGRARAGSDGLIVFKLHNMSELPANLKKVRLSFGPRDEREFDGGEVAPPLEVVEFSKTLDRWPDGNAAEHAKCQLCFERSGGQPFEVTATVALESEELYRRDPLLEEFDL